VHHGETFFEEEGAATSSSNAEVIASPTRDMVMDTYAPCGARTNPRGEKIH